ncbi:protein-L-isoaspartate(D-aspartate) O-methyltransferase [Herbihabitans rhizosphaerae]|uniref:Protein-L-isoaspartate O-methyltransferase n=1 Tax=Herbihabitans rhizosphaerae TaxID=1872711 RepID=A0A4Q7KWD1_9PSEU|nr:ATP-grasp peptide maturase system methyltransferase [Herbihabitans rhizosphaerae]RZS40886.1 protein-L-isoaspartate(D-aspartate) O-methyltransferase [Herbihabitans rhizosphaerae]
MTTDWRPRAAALADKLRASGKLTTPEWHSALSQTPRHVFVPEYYRQDRGAEWIAVRGDNPAQREKWLDAMYDNTVLVTALADNDNGGQLVRSSSTQPGLMVRMLEALEVRDGNTVLEIGAGTGYNAALLSQRLGDGCVYSVDIEPDLVDLARERLAEAGHHPTVVARDGADGFPEHAPFDRLIATCSVPAIPAAWVRQVRPGGKILADIKTGVSAGSLVLLTRYDDDAAVGRFDPVYAAFMALRPSAGVPAVPTRVDRNRDAARQRTSQLNPTTPWDNLLTWFLASFTLGPDVAAAGYTGPDDNDTNEQPAPAAVWITTPDGSWTEISLRDHDGEHRVHEGGPRNLWTLIEQAHRDWTDHGQPDWDRLGLTVTRDEQRVWLDEPSGPTLGTLPTG